MSDHQPVTRPNDSRQRLGRHCHIDALRLSRQRLTALQKCIGPQCCDNQHL